ncbi:MAG: ADP-glyceromanno-heptose 6-epimerase [Chitinophagaceae bacterium]
MNTSSQIIVTGAAGFIGSCMVQYLNENGYRNLILVDDFGVEAKRVNWQSKAYAHIVERYNLFDWLELYDEKIDFVFHLGARTDTTEFDYSIHQELNVDYSEKIWSYCTEKQVPLVYASSAATYGGGEFGYNDDHAIIDQLQPLNPYGISKNEFDKWVLKQIAHSHSEASPNASEGGGQESSSVETVVEGDGAQQPSFEGREASPEGGGTAPPFWAGLKFFNVYGPNEYHKGRMASVIWHSFNQINKDGQVKLFKSHRPDFEDGQQLRDFVYVKDVVKVMYWLMENSSTYQDSSIRPQGAIVPSAIYNLGTGKARSFYDLATSTFRGLDLKPNIVFIPMPEDIRDKYQYFTEANMQKLRDAGYGEPFYSLEEGVEDYVRHYLQPRKIY